MVPEGVDYVKALVMMVFRERAPSGVDVRDAMAFMRVCRRAVPLFPLPRYAFNISIMCSSPSSMSSRASNCNIYEVC